MALEWGDLRAQSPLHSMDWESVQQFQLVDLDRSPATVEYRARNARHMGRTGLDWESFAKSPDDARAEGRRWLATKKLQAGRRVLANYEQTLNDVAAWLASVNPGFRDDSGRPRVHFTVTDHGYGHPDPYNAAQWAAILAYRHRTPFIEKRRRAMIYLLSCTGLRRSEVRKGRNTPKSILGLPAVRAAGTSLLLEQTGPGQPDSLRSSGHCLPVLTLVPRQV